MNILFLSLLDFESFSERNIYCDLLREFIKNGHVVCCISPVEKRRNQESHIIYFGENKILKLRIGNIQKVNWLEKGISTLRIERQFISGIKKWFSGIKFDLVLYATPPVTFARVIRYVKKKCGAKSYLMLKDIFPQNAVDLGIMSKNGPKSFLYRYFRHKEKILYHLSDFIGCMSSANMKYILDHNPEIKADKVEVCPNAIEPVLMRFTQEELQSIRDKYKIPRDRIIFVYGGNLGKPQGIPFLIECLKAQKDNKKAFYIVVGSGTEFSKLQHYVDSTEQDNLMLLKSLPKDEYDRMICACDVGMIFLDHRFTIPNFPSRLLAYMQAGLPILACTDQSTDIGKVIVEGEFGWWCESNDIKKFSNLIEQIINTDLSQSAEKVGIYLKEYYSTEKVFSIIMHHWE
ncbi:glycosyltransferase WbuB [Flavonifractor sp. An82]|uniref:glycosyltransferase family 4 protein n=1 Tax=Flavonifractor sp. An82 TaxID=1965660 RepID=UPI000B36EBFB|nr:glycosyltransferase family 4 protein [Flavonifractor sp. An82]OUN20044.1 glycosyltransferase WbuB [Flavonifractor sp. An82]